MKKQTVDLGEYKVVIEHDETLESGHLVVTVLDELEEEIESIKVSNSEDE